MGLERDWLNLARTIFEHHTESITNVRKKSARNYNRSNHETPGYSLTKFLNKVENQREIL